MVDRIVRRGVPRPSWGEKTVSLTAAERSILRRALTIGAEDGSIYPTETDPSKQEASDRDTNAAIERLQAKLAD